MLVEVEGALFKLPWLLILPPRRLVCSPLLFAVLSPFYILLPRKLRFAPRFSESAAIFHCWSARKSSRLSLLGLGSTAEDTRALLIPPLIHEYPRHPPHSAALRLILEMNCFFTD